MMPKAIAKCPLCTIMPLAISVICPMCNNGRYIEIEISQEVWNEMSKQSNIGVSHGYKLKGGE